jgi:cytidylate kinase
MHTGDPPPGGNRVIVAIDGPAGAGKSTVARALAERLGFRYLDTGAMYRALTWVALRNGVALDDGIALAALAEAHPVRFEADGTVLVDDADVTSAIRTPEIDSAVPTVALHVQVREVMRDRQRALGERSDSVIEGRDIGAVVAPAAEVKVYLEADASVRASRRAAERPGTDEAALGADLRRRDDRDAANTHLAADAVAIDTTGLTIDEVVGQIEALVRSRCPV